MKYKKFFIMLVLIVSSLLLMASSTQGTIVVRNGEANPGETIVIPVEVTDAAFLVSMSLEVEYDESVMTMISVNDTGILSGAMHSDKMSSPYMLTWENDIATTDYRLQGELVSLTFVINGDAEVGQYEIQISTTKHGILDCDGNEVPVQLVSGMISITEQEEHTCSWSEWEKVDSSYHARSCSCGAYEEKRHIWDEEETVPATHTSEGEIRLTCEMCGAVDYEVVEPLEGHNWGTYEKYDDTYHVRECECGAVKRERHDWDEGEITEEPTEGEPGLKVYTCEVCGGTKTEVLDALPHEHDMVRTPAKTPTCKEEGNNEYYTCRKCDKVYKDEDGIEETTVEDETLPKSTTHTSEVVTGKKPTCTEPGLTDGEKCSVCGKILVEQEPIDPAGHTWGQWEKFDDTYHIHQCECGEYEKLAHDWDEGEIIEEPTEDDPGLKKYTCETCGGIKHEILDALLHEHDMVRTPAKAPTCKETGNNEYYTCRDCGKVYKDAAGTQETTVEAETLPKSTTHTTEVIRGKAPTCTEPGLTDGEKCSVCGKILVEQEPIDPTGHTWGEWEKYDAVYHIHRCACGETEKMAHNWDDGVVVKKPSATEPGTRRYTCELCGETLETDIPALGGCDGGEDCPLQRFVDVDSSHWAHEGLDFAVNRGLMNGTGNGTTFEPEKPMSRAMLVTVLHRYAGSPYPGESNFADVKPGDWFYAGVSWAANNGVVNGVGDGSSFDPNADVTREMMATILFRYANKIGVDTSKRADISGYPDETNVAGWSREAVRWAVAEGIISGAVKDGQTVLAPQDSANRAVVATIMMRFIQNVVEVSE